MTTESKNIAFGESAGLSSADNYEALCRAFQLPINEESKQKIDELKDYMEEITK